VRQRAPEEAARVKKLGLVLLVLASGGWGWDVLRAPDPDVEKGNGAFQDGKYAEALGHYDAAEENGADPRIQFDRGAALYKLGEQAKDPAEKAKLMEQAEQAFERAADTEDARLKSDAYQALGNALYQRQRFEEAVDKYRRALRANPQNDPARYNLEMALRQRQKNPQQQQQQGQQGQQGQPQQNDPQQGQQGQPQQNDPQQGQQQGQPQQNDPQQGQQQGQPQPNDPQQQGQGQPQQDPQQGQGQGQQQQKDPTQGNPNAQKQDPGQGQQGQQPQPDPNDADAQKGQRPGDGSEEDESAAPSDQDQKLDALERRSRDLRKRLLRKGSRTRDPLRLPSRKDW
jgi:tetratricopeptide (TPR) repeat protein